MLKTHLHSEVQAVYMISLFIDITMDCRLLSKMKDVSSCAGLHASSMVASLS